MAKSWCTWFSGQLNANRRTSSIPICYISAMERKLQAVGKSTSNYLFAWTFIRFLNVNFAWWALEKSSKSAVGLYYVLRVFF